MNSITAVVITFNEERNIERCLLSLKPVADEILVFDSFSTDNTRKIARELGAGVIKVQWQGYSATKNNAIEEAKHPFLLFLDADEAISPQLAQSILKEKSAGLKRAYEFSRLNSYCGKWLKHGGFYPDKKVRLFQRNYGKWSSNLVHESVDLRPDVQVEHLDGDLLHYTYYTISEHVARANQYSTLAAEALIANGKRQNLVKLLINPQWRFFKNYFLRRGFLDGFYGFSACTITAFEVFLKYAKAISAVNAQKFEE